MCTKIIPKECFVYVTVFIAHLGIFLNGIAISWSSPILFKLNHLEDNPLKRKITILEQTWLLSVKCVASWFGSVTAGCVAKKYGRKPALIIMTLPELISYVMLCLADTISLMLIARTLNGLSLGAMFTLIPIYCGEVAEAKNRGRLGGSALLFLNSGFLFAFCVGPYTTFRQFHVIIAVMPALHIILIFTVLPETPYYLIGKNYNRAKKTLRDLRGVEDVGDELTKIQNYVDQKKDVSQRDIIKNKEMRRGLIIGCGLCFFQQGSGSCVLMAFGQLIFAEVSDFLPNAICPIIVGIAQVTFALIAPAVIDRTGRKILLIVSEIGISISSFCFGLYFFLKDQTQAFSMPSWFPLVAVVLFKLSFCIGVGSVPYVVVGEIFPLKTKAAAASIAAIFGSTASLLETNTFNLLYKQIGIGPSFWVFSFTALLYLVFVIVFVFETKGKTLQEIQEVMKRHENIVN